jgi:hypothetical protein
MAAARAGGRRLTALVYGLDDVRLGEAYSSA